MSTKILYNNLAGHGKTEEKAKDIAEKTSGELIDITKIESYKELFSGMSDNDTVVICGGDGTLNRFVNDTEGIDISCNILYCALGTGNDFLHDIGRSAEDCPVEINKYIKDLPSVTVNGKSYRFLNNVGFGIDGYCCEVGDKQKAESDKPVNYTAIAIKGLLFHFKPRNAKVKVDGKEYDYKKVWIAPTMKGRYYGGGMMPTPSQDRCADDGKLSLMLYHGVGKLKALIVFPSIFKGEHVKQTKMVTIHEGYDIEVSFDKPTALQIDGETILGVESYKATAKVAARV